ncbi:oral-facial-digital syndrome 1 protein isoform X1 [Python bivittatus]|uniref:Oral-facial-digital syndrome 1 protein isoform X1 n=1 Tax=Python bivittatus TaxID=176946 RepID=A0A9F5IQ79_PYTBI|nr:oral-facial-digital syndrome 1 protein isoform X1 [Python bivittatus]XP_025021641.1 oral-facial-digital syndrome 1 protein isoform X1 [Python bivittatus]XP_025021642.1 oral-facial-digital syndrome 1 protein isoform X1 [Python bivittatus]
MSSAEFKALSQDELRKRLYQTFKNRGVLDTLKTQLRKQLIHELMNPVLCREILPKAISSECSSLIIVACNSLVADHLRRCGYEYSLSVFYPESGLEKDKELSIQDLLRLIRISPASDLYKMLISDSTKTSMKGFLVQILTELAEYNLCKETCNIETQTSSTLYKESLAEKLQLIDEQFADMYPQRHLSESFHVKFAEYKRDIEQQLQAEMSQKLQHFKDVEIAKIKMDERAQSQKEISELRKQFQKDHQAKSEALTSRERNAIERLHKQQEIDAKEIYLQRQTLLKDIETVRSREEELKKRIEAFEIAQKLQESKNKTVEDALHRREIAVKNTEETYDQKLKNELLKYQLELKEEYITRTKKIAENEREQKEKAMLLHEETISLNSKKQEFNQAVLRAKERELEIDSVKTQVLLLSKQNQLLTEKLKEVSDYPTLKEEKIEYQVQNKLLEQQLEEAHNENLRLQEKLNGPSSDFVVLQAELKRIEHARRLEREESETHKQLLEKQLQKEMDHCVQLKSQLSEYENTIRKLNVQIEELKLQWKQTQTALENEVYRNPKPSLVDRSVIDLIEDKIVPHDIYIDRAFLKTQPMTSIGMGNTASPSHHNHILKFSMSPDSDLEFVATTKARIKELEREAEYLEEAYRNYQHKVTQRAVGPIKTPSSFQSPSNCILASQQRKRSTQENLLSQERSLHFQKSKSCTWAPGDGNHLKVHLSATTKKTPSRRLSSTPVSKARRNISKNLFNEDTIGSSLAVPLENGNHPLSPILRIGNCSSPDSACSSPVPNKQQLSLYQELENHQNISSTANPVKVLDEDLGNHNSVNDYQEDIPEQLKSDVSHPSGDIVSWNHVPASMPAAGISQQEISRTEKTVLEGRHPEEEKEPKWEEERAEEEKRQSERPLERDQGELEQLDKEIHVQESLEMNEEIQNEIVTNVQTSTLKSEEHSDAGVSNPLEKYMKIIQQSQDKEQEKKKAEKEAVEIPSEGLGSEREDSFSAADILHEGPDDNFW